MININDKHNCCGCNACVQICPKQCIFTSEDNEGFIYPHVNTEKCIDCGLCELVCPVINQNESKEPLVTYAAKNKNDDVRLNSSSGGVFTLFAEHIIAEGGIVFGAKFNDNWEVSHNYTETIQGLALFRGSKYVQSIIGDSFKLAKQFLNDGRKVLFSGTPCQIAGLKKYLRKEYELLLTIEVVCHGVPSAMVWRDYLDYRCKRYHGMVNRNFTQLKTPPVITDISFRDKTDGWKKYGLKVSYAYHSIDKNHVPTPNDKNSHEITPFNKDIFMKGFLQNLYLRPSCYSCPARQGKSGADISIADYWGVKAIHPNFDDDKGVGAIIVNTEVGERYFNNIKDKVYYQKSDYQNIIKNNPCIINSVTEPAQRAIFWDDYKTDGIECINKIYDSMTPSKSKLLIKRVLRRIKQVFRL